MLGPAVSLYLFESELATIESFLRRRVVEDLSAMERREASEPPPSHGYRSRTARLADSGLCCDVLFPWWIAGRMLWRQGRSGVRLPHARIRYRPAWRGLRVLVEFRASGRAVLDALRREAEAEYAEPYA